MNVRRILSAALVGLLLCGTFVVAWTALEYERVHADERGRAAAARAAAVTEIAVGRATGSLEDLAGLFDASQSVGPAEFAAFADRVLGRGGLAGVGWIERVPAAGRAAWEARTGLRVLDPDGAGTQPAADRPELFPLALLATDLSTGGVRGLDSSNERQRQVAMERAVLTGMAVLTTPVALYGSGDRGLLIYQPIYTGGGTPDSPAARRVALRGFVVGAYRLEALMRAVVRAVGVDTPIEIRDAGVLLSPPGPDASDVSVVALEIGGRAWSVTAGRPAPSRTLPLLLLVGGLLVTVFAAGLVVVVARRDRFAAAAVARATADLRTSEDRYGALVTSLSDGIVRHDPSGAIVSWNPAAATILGLTGEQLAGRQSIDPRWGAVREDCSPYPADDHPAMRTLRTGVPLDGEVMGVHRPDGSLVWLSVATRPLVEEGVRTVVTCFTDITVRLEADREQAALRRVATLVAANADTTEVLDLVAREAADLTGAEAAGVVRFDEERRHGTVAGSYAPEVTAAPVGASLDLSLPTATGIVAATGEVARVGVGVGAAATASALIPGAHVASSVAAPIRVDNRLWGAVAAVTTRGETPLAPGTGERLARFGELITLAIMSSEARARLAMLAGTDDLTGLPNRRAFTEGLAGEIERSRRYGGRLSLVMLDIDNFKDINDAHGHPSGDQVLMGVAARLFANVRDGEMVARVGGEEFAWILPETGGPAALAAAERLRRQIAAAAFDGVGTVTVSMGICELDASHTASELLSQADAALYRAKARGRDRVVRHRPGPQPTAAVS